MSTRTIITIARRAVPLHLRKALKESNIGIVQGPSNYTLERGGNTNDIEITFYGRLSRLPEWLNSVAKDLVRSVVVRSNLTEGKVFDILRGRDGVHVVTPMTEASVNLSSRTSVEVVVTGKTMRSANMAYKHVMEGAASLQY